MAAEPSIFKSTKVMLDIAPDDESFDGQIMTLINGAFSDLSDLGAGPSAGVAITGDGELWASLTESPATTNRIRTWLWLKVRLQFDPPQTSFLIDLLQKQLDKAEWQIVNNKDGLRWLDEHPDYVDLI